MNLKITIWHYVLLALIAWFLVILFQVNASMSRLILAGCMLIIFGGPLIVISRPIVRMLFKPDETKRVSWSTKILYVYLVIIFAAVWMALIGFIINIGTQTETSWNEITI